MQEFDYCVDFTKVKSSKVIYALSRKYKVAHKISSDMIHKLMKLTALKLSEEIVIRLEKECSQDQNFKDLYQRSEETLRRER